MAKKLLILMLFIPSLVEARTVFNPFTGRLDFVDDGSGGGSDNLGSHAATDSVKMPFGFSASSGVMTSSLSVAGIITSTTGFQVGASTVQGVFMLGGGTFQFRNGTNEFSIVFASGGYAVGDRLIVSQVTGNRMMIASGKAVLDTSGAGDPNIAVDTTTLQASAISMSWDGGGAPLDINTTYWTIAPASGTIIRAVISGLPSGSLSVSISSSQVFNVGHRSICAPSCPALTSAEISFDTVLSGWDTSIQKDQFLYFVVNSVGTINRARIDLFYNKQR